MYFKIVLIYYNNYIVILLLIIYCYLNDELFIFLKLKLKKITNYINYDHNF